MSNIAIQPGNPNEKDIARYRSIIVRFNQSQDPNSLSKDDWDFFLNFTPKVDEAAMQKIISSKDANGNSAYTEEQIGNALSAMMLAAQSTPEYKGKLVDLYATKKAGEVAGTVRSALNTVLAASDVASAKTQINQSRQAMRDLRRPQRPTPLAADPLLKQAMNSAQTGTLDAARRVAPAQQALLDNYLSDVNNARTASTGQAGAFGAGAQVASTRRSRGAMGLAPIIDDIKAREQARYDQLLGMKLNENQNIQASAAQYYPTDLDAYYNERASAAQLGGMGRENLRAGYANLLGGVPDSAAQIALKKRLRAYRQMGLQGGKVAQDAYVAAQEAMAPPQNPRGLSQQRVGNYDIPYEYAYNYNF